MHTNSFLIQTGKDPYYKAWHKSDRNMLLYVHEGDGNIVAREKSYPIQPGILCFIGAEKYHYTFPEHINRYTRSKLFFSSTDLYQLLRLFPEGSPVAELFSPTALTVAPIPVERQPQIEVLLQELKSADPTAQTYPASFFSAVLHLMACLSQNVTSTTPNLSSAMQKAVDYINRHITEEITIEDLCSAAYLSKYHFCRQFKQKTGLTAMEYILKTRLVMAKEMLASKQSSIGEISDTCGFSSLSYFCRVFKDDTGLSPLQYRKRM